MSRLVPRLVSVLVLGTVAASSMFPLSAQQVAVQPQTSAKGQQTQALRRGAPPPPAAVEVTARQIALFGKATGVGPGGRLEFVGGLILTSPSKDFGGWSGAVMSDDGRRLFAISDRGIWLTADLVYDGPRPKGLARAMIGETPGSGGQALSRFRDRDSESVTLLDGTLSRGTMLVGFERNHRIGRFPLTEQGLGPPQGFLKMPPEARKMGSNRGFEAVAVVRGGPLKGAIVAFAEEFFDADRNHTGWIWTGGIGSDPQAIKLKNIADFAVTDAASLPDGSLIVLERKFRWLEGVKTRLRMIRAADLRPGAVLDGEILLDADMAAEIDNMEGLAVSRNSAGRIVLTLISDNNFNSFLQRTLLLQFTLNEPATAAGANKH